jgi:acid phosphatase type 7
VGGDRVARCRQCGDGCRQFRCRGPGAVEDSSTSRHIDHRCSRIDVDHAHSAGADGHDSVGRTVLRCAGFGCCVLGCALQREHRGRGPHGLCELHTQVSDLIVGGRNIDALIALGDLQYDNGEPQNYADSYRNSYGRLRSITHPVPGNHDYYTPGGRGYHDFFGARAGEQGKGWCSVDIAPGWHLVVLNSNCDLVGGCASGSEQERWLRADLAATTAPCVIGAFHHPRFTSNKRGDNTFTAPLWQALEERRATFVLSGHEHNYERFAPRRSTGETGGGVRSFVVGTGGRNVYGFDTPQPGSEFRLPDTFGYLRLTLNDRAYTAEFVAENGEIKDTTTGTC